MSRSWLLAFACCLFAVIVPILILISIGCKPSPKQIHGINTISHSLTPIFSQLAPPLPSQKRRLAIWPSGFHLPMPANPAITSYLRVRASITALLKGTPTLSQMEGKPVWHATLSWVNVSMTSSQAVSACQVTRSWQTANARKSTKCLLSVREIT